MKRYALLVTPSANRVYGRAAPRLAAAETQIVLGLDANAADIARVPYVVFDVDGPDLSAVARLSSAHALFEVHGEALQPVELPLVERHDDDLVTIQRYQGKTNERFTRLLLNVTLACGAKPPSGRPRVLDPVAGRGTTLNQALLLGMDAAGIEVDRPAYEAWVSFIKTWLKDKRLKHHVEEGTVRKDGKILSRRFDATIARTKTEQKDGDVQTVRFVNDDTRNALEHFRQQAFDAIVGDLPYGVQHGRKELVAEAAPGWAKLLRHGACIGLAFNAKAQSRAELEAALTAAGLSLVELRDLSHRVDRAVLRDVVVAMRS